MIRIRKRDCQWIAEHGRRFMKRNPCFFLLAEAFFSSHSNSITPILCYPDQEAWRASVVFWLQQSK